jgi:hypothetical protein
MFCLDKPPGLAWGMIQPRQPQHMGYNFYGSLANGGRARVQVAQQQEIRRPAHDFYASAQATRGLGETVDAPPIHPNSAVSPPPAGSGPAVC